MDNTVIEELESFIFLGSQKHNASFEDDDLIAPVPLIHAAQFLADDCPNKSLRRNHSRKIDAPVSVDHRQAYLAKIFSLLHCQSRILV